MTTTGIILLCIAAVLVIALLAAFLVLKIRARRFRPTGDKAAQQAALNRELAEAGFAYDRKEDIFYSLMDCWQREMGYCQLYDEGSSLFNMVMHCEPVRFSYAGKRWMIELWKGQYGITTGAEVGIYNTDHRSGGRHLQHRSGRYPYRTLHRTFLRLRTGFGTSSHELCASQERTCPV